MVMSTPKKPPPPSRPDLANVQVVKAIYPYVAQRPDELTFEEGDTLYIMDKSNPNGWWKAKCGNQTGMIPSNYVEGKTETIDNPLHEAAKRGNVDFLNECLTNRISVNSLDKSGSTPLHWAASGGHLDCAVALLNVHNITLNNQNKLGDTALHNAAWKGHADIVQALLERGAVKNMQNNDKKTPYALARNPEVARLLKDSPVSNAGDYGADDDEDDE